MIAKAKLIQGASFFTNLLLVVITAYLIVNSAYDLLKIKVSAQPVPVTASPGQMKAQKTAKPTLEELRSLVQRHPFGEAKVEAKEASKEKVLEPTTLKLNLVGTVVGDGINSYAVIEDVGKKTHILVRVGDKIQGGEILTIERMRVILKVGEKEQVLAFKDTKPSPAPGGIPAPPPGPQPPLEAKEVTLNRQEVMDQLNKLPQLMTQVSVAPYFKDGQPAGIGLSRISPGSIFQKMGLQNGDVIVAVEDNPIRSSEDLINLYDSLKNADRVKIQLERRGALTEYEYKIQ